MNDEEKTKFINTVNDKILSICDQVIHKCVSDENFEDAAKVRDARLELVNVISTAIYNLFPF